MDEDEPSQLQGSDGKQDAGLHSSEKRGPPPGLTVVPLVGRLHLDKDFSGGYLLADTQTLQQHFFHKSGQGDMELELLFSEDGCEVCNNSVGWVCISGSVCYNFPDVIVVCI